MTMRPPRSARLARVELPDFGMPGPEPAIPREVYAARLERLRIMMEQRGLDHVLVWADREHSANLAYLTGVDPRFEEALLVLGRDGDPALLLGNECIGLAAIAPVVVRPVLHQDLSLPDQPRGDSQPLGAVLRAEGIASGSTVGVVGWKTYASRRWIEAPAFLVDELRELTGAHGRVESATDLLIDAGEGLRTVNEPEQIAAFEWAACHTSTSVRSVLRGLYAGMTERDAALLLGWAGMPLSCHLMLTAGERARHGLLSPGDRPIERGDPFTIAYGIWGALTCRAGFVVEDAAELPADVGDYVERLVAPYMEAVAAWYEALRVGQTGGELYSAVHDRIGDPFFGVSLNPGHHIHLDEWVSSPVQRDSPVRLRSGAALQCDIIPATGTRWFTTNVEDGVALADDDLRTVLASRYPAMWSRIQARRSFMIDVLGIQLHADVLPLSTWRRSCHPSFSTGTGR